MNRFRFRFRLWAWSVLDSVGYPATEGPRVARRRRADWATRLQAHRVRHIGMTPAAYRAELVSAALAWHWSRPWRYLPEPFALFLFPYAGRRFAARWLAASREG